jgi:glycerophosphoryl diester phosphodiesterase family protein
MGNILYPPARPQSVGEVLDTAFRIYSSTLVKCLPYSFASVILGQLLSVYDLLHRHATTVAAIQVAQMQRLRDPLWLTLFLILIVVSTTFANAVFLRQYALATGRPASMRAELGRGLQRTPGVVLMVLLAALAFLGTLIPVMIVVGAIGGVLGIYRAAPVPSSQVWLMLAIFLIMLLAGSWVVIRWICSVPIYLLTPRGAIDSMSHSWQLTVGNFWRLSIIYSVGVALILVFYVLASVTGGVVALLVGRGDLVVFLAVSAAAIALLAAVFTPFYYALVLAVYGDLAARREGADLAKRIAAPVTP